MKITTNVQLEGDETLAYTPDAAAMQVLVALGGNAQTDYSIVYVQAPIEPGEAGTPPPPPDAAPGLDT
jgi:hypothetical protein